MNPSVRAHELIDLSRSMVQVMATETELLKSGKVDEIESFQAQKEALSGIYETHMRDVAAEPGMFNAVDPALRAELTEAARQIDATARENKHAVQAAMELNARLVQVIADAVTKSAPSASGYTKTGAAPASTAAVRAPRPATLNQSL